MSRSISISVEITEAPGVSAIRAFSRVQFTVTSGLNMSGNIFVVDTSRGPDDYRLMYVATPQDMQDIPDDTPNAENLLRVDTVSLYVDNSSAVPTLVDDVKQRVDLLVTKLAELDLPGDSFDFTVSA